MRHVYVCFWETSNHTNVHHVLAGSDDHDDAESETEEDEGADTSFRSGEHEDDLDDGIDAFLKSDEEDLVFLAPSRHPSYRSCWDVHRDRIRGRRGKGEGVQATSLSVPESPTQPHRRNPSHSLWHRFHVSYTPQGQGKRERRRSNPAQFWFIREVQRLQVPCVAFCFADAAGTSASSAFLGVRPSTRPVRRSLLLNLRTVKMTRTMKRAVRPKTPPVLFGTSVARVKHLRPSRLRSCGRLHGWPVHLQSPPSYLRLRI